MLSNDSLILFSQATGSKSKKSHKFHFLQWKREKKNLIFIDGVLFMQCLRYTPSIWVAEAKCKLKKAFNVYYLKVKQTQVPWAIKEFSVIQTLF